MKKVKSYSLILSDDEKKNIIIDYVSNKFSIKELMLKYKIKSKSFITKLLGNKIRSVGEASYIAHKKYHERFFHTEETKKKMSEKRLLYLKEHRECTAWRRKNMSYPEKVFFNFLVNNGYDKKYLIVREYSVFPYYIDYAFIDLKIAIEIDGSQHLEEDRKKKDEEKDKLLQENGWKIIRFTAKFIKENYDEIKNILDKFIISDNKYEKVGIYKNSDLKKNNRNFSYLNSEKKFTEKEINRIINNRKVKNRPSKDELISLTKTNSFVSIGKFFNVSDKTISNWCKLYGIPYRKKDIKNGGIV